MSRSLFSEATVSAAASACSPALGEGTEIAAVVEGAFPTLIPAIADIPESVVGTWDDARVEVGIEEATEAPDSPASKSSSSSDMKISSSPTIKAVGAAAVAGEEERVVLLESSGLIGAEEDAVDGSLGKSTSEAVNTADKF